MPGPRDIVLLPDAGPLITVAYAEALDLLLEPGWPVAFVDTVLHEVTRNRTPTSEKIAQWADQRALPVMATRTFQRHRETLATGASLPPKANLGELAIQEVMNDLALGQPQKTAVFLFEDHRIARASFLVPENCRKVSTRAFLMFLEEEGLLASAAEVERRAILNGRQFSSLRFPP